MGGAMLLGWGLALVIWRPCREREGRAPRAAVALLLLSSASVWLGSFAVAVQFAAQEPAGAWTACGVLWQQIVTGQVDWWRIVPLVAWFTLFPVRGAVALAAHELRLLRMARDLRRTGTALPDASDVLVVSGLGTPAVALGLVRPRILIDQDFWQRATMPEREVVLAHERAHARGRHALVDAMTTLLIAPFRPLAAADEVYECVRRHLEALADDTAVRILGRETVGRAIGQVALEAFPAAGLGATGACLWRVRRLLTPTDELVRRDRAIMASMVVMMAVMLIVAGAETASALGPVAGADFCPLPS